jgi:hypothetical protein
MTNPPIPQGDRRVLSHSCRTSGRDRAQLCEVPHDPDVGRDHLGRVAVLLVVRDQQVPELDQLADDGVLERGRPVEMGCLRPGVAEGDADSAVRADARDVAVFEELTCELRVHRLSCEVENPFEERECRLEELDPAIDCRDCRHSGNLVSVKVHEAHRV